MHECFCATGFGGPLCSERQFTPFPPPFLPVLPRESVKNLMKSQQMNNQKRKNKNPQAQLMCWNTSYLDRAGNIRITNIKCVQKLISGPCDSAPCQNNGTCRTTAAASTYFCDCQHDHGGKNCEFGEKKLQFITDSPSFQ